jgi:hypothetical protein
MVVSKNSNREFDADDWSGFEYVIVDEVQDLVNERAKMLLKILGALDCGYLLLGDKCQAIYDYDCGGENSMNSVEFYESLNAVLPKDVIKYELIGNKRQTEDLANCSDRLRKALLEYTPDEANIYFNERINVMTHMDFMPIIFSRLSETETYAILTRNNGQAEWISAELHKKDIPHNLLRTVTPQVSLNRWLADMFWDYRDSRITKNDFVERYTIRVKNDEQLAVKSFNAIIETISDENLNDYFELAQLLKSLKKGNCVSTILLNVPCENLTVSTIHKAKGREFDHVFLFNDFTPKKDTQEARVRYVGETRPKIRLRSLKKPKWYLCPTTSRWVWQCVRKNQKWGSVTKFCDSIVVGLRGDINPCGFIEGDLEQAVQRQFYIARNISVNDKVNIYLQGDVYKVYHNGFCIGALSDEAKLDLLNSIKSRYSWSGIPPHLTEVYVNNIISVIPYSFASDVDSMFKDSQFWLGIELTGFAKANWNTRGVVG